jgi:hypothetical protein
MRPSPAIRTERRTVAEATEVSRDDYVDGQARRLTVVTGILSMSSVVLPNGGYGRTEAAVVGETPAG